MLTRHRLLLPLLLLITAFTSPRVAHAQTRSAGLLNFNADGSLFACSNRDSGTVSIVTWPDLKLLHEIPVGLHPEGVAWIGKSGSLACCIYGTDEIAILDATAGNITRRVPVFDEPYGIVSSSDGTRLFATLEYPGQILDINPADGAIRKTWQVGSMLRGLALSPDQKFLLTTEYLTSKVLRVSTTDGTVQQTFEPASTDNLARQIVIAPSADRAWFTHI
ncbi:MAG: YncE family protein, partial [Planctomyces sp.]